MNALRTARGDELDAATLYNLLQLRVSVFIVEQRAPYPELDGRDLDQDTLHLWWQPEGDDRPSACLRVLVEPEGGYRIGRVCTTKQARGSGLGATLMSAALDLVGAADSVLDAQVYAKHFYARFGYEQVGAEYDDDGIGHVTMRRAGRTG